MLDHCGGRFCGDHPLGHADAAAVSGETIAQIRSPGCVPYPVGEGLAGQAEHRGLRERLFGPDRLNLAQGAGGWIEGTLSLKVPISGRRAALGVLPGGMLSLAGCRRICPYVNFWRKSSHVVIPHYWNPQQVERLLDSLAALGLRRARVAALIMWRTGLRVGETVALEWRDIDLTAGSLLVRRGKGGRGRTVPLHPDLASLFANWPTSCGPRDLVAGLTRKTALRHLRAGIEHAGLDEESPGTGRQRAGAHSLRHSAARHWLTTAGIPLNVVSQWLGHATPEVTLRIYLPIVGNTRSMADVP